VATVRALRGVCVGVDQNLAAGEVAELDDPHLPFLIAIKAVEIYTPEPEPEPAARAAQPVKEK
jgi:hypothetical protein